MLWGLVNGREYLNGLVDDGFERVEDGCLTKTVGLWAGCNDDG